MKIAFVASNVVKVAQNTKKGSEIFDYIFLTQLNKMAKQNNLEVTAFASGDSKVPVKLESINYYGSFDDKHIGQEHHKIFELALMAKAIEQQKKFDIFHLSIGNGELILPFMPYIKKPVIVTMHGSLHEKQVQKYFSVFTPYLKGNPHFISISNAQRKPLPNLNYAKTIYHGIGVDKVFKFSPLGGEPIMWAGRAIPQKGLDTVLTVIKQTKKKGKIFPIIKEEYLHWLHEMIIKKRNIINQTIKIYVDFDVHRSELPAHYQSSKVFLFPLEWEEPFGLTMIESLASGTPVIAYARGSVPEIIKDGETGFIVNSSVDTVRGNWIVKKTGLEGLCEAVERIYSMPTERYLEMRRACRMRAQEYFSTEIMTSQYIDMYKKILGKI